MGSHRIQLQGQVNFNLSKYFKHLYSENGMSSLASSIIEGRWPPSQENH